MCLPVVFQRKCPVDRIIKVRIMSIMMSAVAWWQKLYTDEKITCPPTSNKKPSSVTSVLAKPPGAEAASTIMKDRPSWWRRVAAPNPVYEVVSPTQWQETYRSCTNNQSLDIHEIFFNGSRRFHRRRRLIEAGSGRRRWSAFKIKSGRHLFVLFSTENTKAKRQNQMFDLHRR